MPALPSPFLAGRTTSASISSDHFLINDLSGLSTSRKSILAGNIHHGPARGLDADALAPSMILPSMSPEVPRLRRLRSEELHEEKDARGQRVVLGRGGFGEVWPPGLRISSTPCTLRKQFLSR